jgi:hypothetical protein
LFSPPVEGGDPNVASQHHHHPPLPSHQLIPPLCASNPGSSVQS